MTEQQQQVQHMVTLLSGLIQPDTATIRQAEAQLKPVLKQAASMNVLWQVIVAVAGCDAAVRHVAAVVLRKRLPVHYATFDAATQWQWQQQVLQALATEQVRPVRSGLQGVAAALAAQEGSATLPYLQFLQAAAADANPSARELCFLLLGEMTDTIGHHWKEHATALQQLYATALHNPNEVAMVQKAAVSSLGQLLSFWSEDAEIEGLAPLLPVLLQVAAQHAGTITATGTTTPTTFDNNYNSDEDFLSTVLDVLYDLAYSTAPSLLPHLPVTVEFACQCLQSKQLELRVRDAAALVIATTAEAKPKTLGRHTQLLGSVLDALFQLMQESSESAAGALFESNPTWRKDLHDDHNALDDDDEDDDDSPTETSMAQGTLDMLACEIPKKYIWQACITRCVSRMSDTQNAAARKAGVAGLGVIAEGCAEPLTAALPELLPYVFASCTDVSPQVRECACFCLGQISEHCQPDILQYAQQILPTVFGLLDDDSVAVQATSCYVLEMFCERLEPAAVRPVLDPLVRKLAGMLEVTTKRSVQEMAVAALAATAVAAETEFAPYVPGVAHLMQRLMALVQNDQYSLRGRALECMGHMAIAVGRETFRPYFTATMQCAMEGLTMDSTDLQEFAYAVFANLAKVMRDEFAPALPDLVPFLIQVIEQDEGQFEKSEDADDDKEGGGFTGLDDSDDDESESGNMVLHVRTALLEVKKGAITALGEMAAHTGTSFCPYLEQSMQVLQKASTNWHPLIKTEAAEAFPSLIVPSIAAYHNGEIEWEKGVVNTANTTTSMSQHTASIVHAVLQEEITLMKDEEKSTVGKACEAVQSVIELCGPAALLPVLNECLTATHELLVKRAPCQTADGLYGEYPDDDDDHDVVMQAACDLVGAYGRVLGQQFAPYLPQFLPAILDYAKSSRPSSDRSMAVGCLSEIAQEVEGAIGDHWSSVFFPCLVAALQDPDDNVKRNAAFCTGVCAEHLRERIANDYPTLLHHLGPIFQLSESSGSSDATAACTDNASAAVSRMIMACPAQVPLGQVLPVLLSALPLKTDMTENETVYKCLLGLLNNRTHPDVQANVMEMKRIFQQACQPDSSVEEEIQTQLRTALQTLNAQ